MTAHQARRPTPAAVSDSDLAEAARRVADNSDMRRALAGVVDLALDRVHLRPRQRDAGARRRDRRNGGLLRRARRAGRHVAVHARARARACAPPSTAACTSSPTRRPIRGGRAGGPRSPGSDLHSVLSINLFTDHRVLGALNLYYQPRDEFSDDDVEVARVVAAHASVALARVRAEQDLWRAIDSRHLIGQAQGILMERFALSPGARVLRAAPLLAAAQHQAARRGGHAGLDRRPAGGSARRPATGTRAGVDQARWPDQASQDAAQLARDGPQPAGHLHLADADLPPDPGLRPAVAEPHLHHLTLAFGERGEQPADGDPVLDLGQLGIVLRRRSAPASSRSRAPRPATADGSRAAAAPGLRDVPWADAELRARGRRPSGGLPCRCQYTCSASLMPARSSCTRRGGRTVHDWSRKYRLISPTMVGTANCRKSSLRPGSHRRTALIRPDERQLVEVATARPRGRSNGRRSSGRPAGTP